MLSKFKSKKVSCAVVIAMALGPMSSANAAMNGMNTFKEWFNIHAAAGWAVIGVLNLVQVKFRTNDTASTVSAAVKGACGTVAAGVFGKWTPEAPGQTYISHVAGVVKGGAVIGSSSICGWITDGVFSAIQTYGTEAKTKIDKKTPKSKDVIVADVNAANITVGNMISKTMALQTSNKEYTAANIAFNSNKCGVPQFFNTVQCINIGNNITRISKIIAGQVTYINTTGTTLKNQLAKLNRDVNTLP